ncbi:LpxK [Desulforapulum autotrophicum HRM2]|uniref:Tetraacyldisaccharide 4'-kinase n=1 Tax=Desulforapulum autotrophicum (strain ATCC 43914 / DSM 3382 / VKM B-1955 / HRM2) TaxID=177437 RepID=C0QBQ1_DESAH|nr:tetraacyldisaccharide 4'-kinase [Desulforapulum autotrophicum]ACN14913.1 LpxK [Desulforapulum autotrophicum HRM2]
MSRTLIARIETIMSRPVEKGRFLSMENFLLFISNIYGSVVQTRQALYRAGILKSRKLPCFVISVGNIIVGGTGKTPMTIYLADLVRQMGYRVAVVTRGYRGKYEHSSGVVCDGQRMCCTPEESGDEAYMIAQTLGIPVVVGKDRYAVGMMAVKKFNPQVIVLDDAFQHRKLERDLDLVLVDAGKPFGNGKLLPRGRLREPISSIRRSDALVLTRSDQVSDSAESSTLEMIGKKIPMFKTFHIPFIRRIVQDNAALNEMPITDWGQVKGKSCFLFSGLANNQAFQNTCRDRGMKIAGYIDFSDHFWYSKTDIDRIFKRFMDVQADFIVTTEKDYVKIRSRFSLFPIVVVGVKIVFDEASLAPFESFIKTSIRSVGSKAFDINKRPGQGIGSDQKEI